MATQSYDGNLFVESNWGTYSTRLIATWELIGQSTSENKSYIKLRMYFYYGGVSSVSGSGNSTYTIDGQTVIWNGYRVYPGYTYIQEKNIEVTHNADGTFPGRTVSILGGGYSNVSGCSGTGTITGVATIPRASQPSINTSPTNSPNFSIGDTITIYMNRKSNNFTHKVYFNYGNTNYLVAENVTNSCTFDTSIIANDLYDLIPTSNVYTNTILVRTYNGNTLIGTKTCQYNANIINANPTFSNFEFEDTNTTTIALTGNNQICINGYSNIKATISTTNKATALKSATMNKYRFINNDMSVDIAYSDSQSVSGTINNVSNGVFNVYAIDSRNNSTLVTKLAQQEILYNSIYLDKQNCSIHRNSGSVGGNAILTLNGTIWNDNFGNVTNSITSVVYKFKKTDSSQWITGTTTITPTITDDKFTFTGQIASDNLDTTWDLDASYNVKIIVSDELSNSTVDLVLNSAVPTMSLDKNGVGIMCSYDSSKGGYLQVNGKSIETIIQENIEGEILWENQNPTASTFSTQNINLNSSDYDYYEIIVNWASAVNRTQSSGKVLKGTGTVFNFVSSVSYYRTFNYVSDTEITVSNATIYDIKNSSSNTGNEWFIPLYVIGYKTNIFN